MAYQHPGDFIGLSAQAARDLNALFDAAATHLLRAAHSIDVVTPEDFDAMVANGDDSAALLQLGIAP
jgi:hypothetical protein